MTPIYFTWTDEADAILIDLYKRGYSFTLIAEELNQVYFAGGRTITRNACIGRAHRLKISGGRNIATRIMKRRDQKPFAYAPPQIPRSKTPPVVAVSPPAPLPGGSANRGEERSPRPKTSSPHPAPTRALPIVCEVLPRGPRKGVSFMDQRDGMCRFPISGNDVSFVGFRVCGDRTAAGDVYCTEHHGVMYQPRSRKRVSAEGEESRSYKDYLLPRVMT